MKMIYFVIFIVSFLVATLTFFSGFGLGTLLMPVFALFYPIELAVAATAIVHLANNLFKILLVGKNAHLKTVIIFGLPAIAFAIAGAFLLNYVTTIEPIITYTIKSKSFSIEWIKVIIAILMIVFTFIELDKRFEKFSFNPKYLAVGGMLSGFFGGVSGHQGALRAAFLTKVGLTKEQFIGTSVVVSVLVDILRLVVYSTTFLVIDLQTYQGQNIQWVLLVGIFSAFLGSFIGMKLVKKITLRTIQVLVGILLFFLALSLGFGLI